MSTLKYKKIVLGVTGGIAIYKSADLVRQLKTAGAEVRVVMTKAATALVAPLTFQALSGHQVLLDWDQPESDFAMDHIALARWADVILIAPITADFMAKLTYGFANDILATICLATTAPLVLAPAMNQQMWKHPATQKNKDVLLQRHVYFVGPSTGDQACGDIGEGRMSKPSEILAFVSDMFGKSFRLSGKKVLITAGATQEPIDPVRYISNHSSGKMGYALTQAMLEEGADVILVSGPSALMPSKSIKFISVQTAQQMYEAVMQEVTDCDIFIAAAAVSDYRSEQVMPQKIKKQTETLQLKLYRNPDILAAVTQLEHPPFVLGFAAETENVMDYAKEKMCSKKLDMIAVNDVSKPGSGFLSDENELTVLWKGNERHLPLSSKTQLARELVAILLEVYK